jgi:hypothetical protein
MLRLRASRGIFAAAIRPHRQLISVSLGKISLLGRGSHQEPPKDPSPEMRMLPAFAVIAKR